MTKYVRVDSAPETVSREETVITFPDFVKEVGESKIPTPSHKTFSSHYTRALAEEVAIKYDEKFDVFRNIKTHVLNDVPFTGNVDKAAALVGLFKSQYPAIFDAYINTKIKSLPFGVKVIYFVGPHSATTSFSKNGIDSISVKEADELLGKKKKAELPSIEDLLADEPEVTLESTKKKKK